MARKIMGHVIVPGRSGKYFEEMFPLFDNGDSLIDKSGAYCCPKEYRPYGRY